MAFIPYTVALSWEIWLFAGLLLVSTTITICTWILSVRARKPNNPQDLEKLLLLDDEEASSCSTSLEAAKEGDWKVAEAALKENVFEAAESLMDELLMVNLEPDAVVCFNAMISRSCAEGDAERAKHWLEQMLVHGVPPDIWSFKPAISMLARKGDIHEALHWLQLMRPTRVEPDTQCYKMLLCACSTGDDMTKAQELLFEEMGKSSIDEERLGTPLAEESFVSQQQQSISRPLPDACYNTAVQAWSEARNPRRAEYWMRQGIAAGCRISTQSYGSLIAAFNEAGLEKDAARWCNLKNLTVRPACHAHGIASPLIFKN
jgi:pentatricopeptide repeat protein